MPTHVTENHSVRRMAFLATPLPALLLLASLATAGTQIDILGRGPVNIFVPSSYEASESATNAKAPEPVNKSKALAIEGCWIGTLAQHGQTIGIFGHIKDEGGRLSGLFDVPEIGSYGKVFDRISVQGSTVLMIAGVKREKLVIEAKMTADRLDGVWRTGPISGRVKLERCSNPTPPTVIREDVTFSHGRIRLAGTLVKPAGSGPFPVIVWTHGSGRITRKDWIYSRWVNLLARRGIASLIYDKRGYGKSNGIESTATLQDLAGDLLAGVALVKSRAEFDPKRIGVAGLSQGGWIGPLAASISADVAFVITESAAGMDAHEQHLFVQENILRKNGVAESAVKKIIALHAQLSTFNRTGEGKAALESRLRAASGESWFLKEGFSKPPLTAPANKLNMSRFDLDVVGVWKKVHVPVLAVWGDQDRIVPAEKSRKIIGETLSRIGNTDVHLQTFPGGTHRLTYAKTANDPWSRRRVLPDWPTLLCEWVLALETP